VGDQHDGGAGLLPDPEQLDVHVLAGQRVERSEGLVHQQHRRLVQQGPAQSSALLHPTRQLVRKCVLEARQAGELDQGVRAPRGDVARHTTHLGLQQDVLAHPPPLQEGGPLEREPDLALRAGDPLAEQLHGAAAGPHESRNDLEQRGLAAAGRSDDGDELTSLDPHGDAVEGERGGLLGREAARQVLYVDRGTVLVPRPGRLLHRSDAHQPSSA
jgi:hypothetical protein